MFTTGILLYDYSSRLKRFYLPRKIRLLPKQYLSCKWTPVFYFQTKYTRLIDPRTECIYLYIHKASDLRSREVYRSQNISFIRDTSIT